MVLSGLVTAWRLATAPTRRSPVLVKATTEGVRRAPSLFSSTVGSPASMTATTELVVPKSIPITLGMLVPFPVVGGDEILRSALPEFAAGQRADTPEESRCTSYTCVPPFFEGE